MEKLIAMIEAQQKGHENDDVFTVGEQLKDMASREPAIVELLKQDLEVPEMSLVKAAGKIKGYSDTHRGGKSCFCVSPMVAEGILRKFYGLPKREAGKVQELAPSVSNTVPKLDLSDFL